MRVTPQKKATPVTMTLNPFTIRGTLKVRLPNFTR